MSVQTFAKNEVLKSDTGTGKNYLFPPGIKEMNRLTSIFLDIFEDQLAIGQMTLMGQAVALLDRQLANLGRPVLRNGGSVSHGDAERHVNDEYKKFDMKRKAKRIEEAQREKSALKASEKTFLKHQESRSSALAVPLLPTPRSRARPSQPARGHHALRHALARCRSPMLSRGASTPSPPSRSRAHTRPQPSWPPLTFDVPKRLSAALVAHA